MKHRLKVYEKTVGKYIFAYTDGTTVLRIYKQGKNGKKFLKHIEYGVEIYKITLEGWIFLKKGGMIGAIDFDGNKILPYEYDESFFKKKHSSKPKK